jgi:hypothetical protein
LKLPGDRESLEAIYDLPKEACGANTHTIMGGKFHFYKR